MLLMTFNLRFENEFDGSNGWINRRELVVGLIKRYAPSILGTQEGTPDQLRYLEESLAGYRMHAPGRFWEKTCQYPTLFYDEAGFRVLDGAEFWLSKTPAIHRSKDWDSAFPRMMSYGLFEDLGAGRRLWAAVTHLDHVGAEARKEQAGIIGSWMAERVEPKVLLGDFNDAPGSVAHQVLVNDSAGLYDTWQDLARKEDEDSMTYHGFHGLPRICRMDWVLASRELRAVDALIIRDRGEGCYPSDHFPYLVELKWV